MRRIATVLFGLLALVALAVGFFDWQRQAREIENAADVAPRGGSFVHAYDADVFVQQAGPASAPVVVLIHGTGTWSEIWRDTIDALAPRYRVVAIDLPPFGYSSRLHGASAYTPKLQAQRILGVLDALHVQRATVVGHSVGARPVVALALAAPDRIERLVLVDPALGFDPKPPSRLIAGLFRTKPLRNAVLSTYGTNPLSLRRLFRSFVSNEAAVTDARLEVIRRPMSIAGTTDAYGDWLEALMFSRGFESDRIKKLRMPVHLVWGATDRVTPLWQADVLLKVIPRSRLVVLDGVGHIPYIEDTPHFNAALLASLHEK